MYGPNAVTIAGSPIRQAYMTLHTPVGNGLDWKVGVFDTVVGYESNSDPLNPNYTRSYGYTIEPTTHTGVLASYTVNSEISISAGVANSGYVNSFTPTTTYESQKTYLGSIGLTSPDSWGWAKGSTLNLGVVDSINSTKPVFGSLTALGGGSSTEWYAGLTMPTPWTPLKAGASFDYLDTRSFGGDVWNVALYSTYQATDKLSLNARAEYLDSNHGGVYSGFGGIDNEAEEVTLTAQYNLWANVLSRVEFRVDHVEHGNTFGTNAAGATDKSTDFLLALNLIYQF
jgi:hypothetical protein